MKKTRIEKTIGTKTFNQLMKIYKEAKKTKDIHKILIFKSFITRIINAQSELDENGEKAWTSIQTYLNQVILDKCEYTHNIKKPLDWIIYLAEEHGAFKYDIKKDLRKTF